jgi:predicted dinucleotide-binding enzyme
MKIGIIGSGAVAKVLASGFIKHGHDVVIGTRDAAKLNDWKLANNGVVADFRSAALHGDVVVLAVKGTAAKEVLDLIGHDALDGKIVIDTSNPISAAPPVNGVLNYFTEMNLSLMEILQAHVPSARFVKCWNSVGSAFMVNPDFGGQIPSMFICGNDDAAKAEVKSILTQFGWETCDMGKVEAARAIEPLCMLWCIPGFLNGQWSHAFKLLK